MSIEPPFSTRREFLASTASGVGAIALAHLLRTEGALADVVKKPGENLSLDLKARAPHFAPMAQAMISLFMHGGPSHVDLLDPKPELSKRNGTEYDGDVVFSFVNRASKKLFGTPWKFARHGQCGTEVSELLPETAGIVDDICVIRSMHTGHNGHEVSIRFFHGGIAGITGRPTMGSWLVYGLGSESEQLPAYMVLSDPGGHPVDGTHNWSSGFMPTMYQGTVLRPQEPRILNLDPPAHLRGETQRQNLALLDRLNRRHLESHPGESDLETRIRSYELAAAMQTTAKEALDVANEPAYIKTMYGLDRDETREYGTALPDRPPAGGTRRPVRPAFPGRTALGHAHRHQECPAGDLSAHRQASGGPGQGPQAARATRHDARALGGRDRPPSRHRGQRRHVGRPRS